MDQGSHDYINSAQGDQPSINKHSLRGLDSNVGSNHGWSTRDIQLPKIDMRKFDDKDPLMWIFQIDRPFDTPGAKFTKCNYCIFIFRDSTTYVVPMVVRTQKEHHHLFVIFY